MADIDDSGQETKRLVEKEGRSCLLIPFDLREYRKVDSIIDRHMKEYGKLNVLVNNASNQESEPDISKIDLDQVAATFESNIFQMIAMTKFAVPHLSEGDSIINSTSVTAFRGSAAMVDYSATKGAILSFTKALSAQLAPKKIRVNAVAPGYARPFSYISPRSVTHDPLTLAIQKTDPHTTPAFLTHRRADEQVWRKLTTRSTRSTVRGGAVLRLPRQRRSQPDERHHHASKLLGDTCGLIFPHPPQKYTDV